MDPSQTLEDSIIEKRNLEGWARALFDGIDDAVFVHDLQGRILDANPAACRRLGYTRDELLHLNTKDIDDPEFAAEFSHRLEQQMTEGHLRCVGKHRTKDGRSILVDINSSAIEVDNKPCVLAVMRDITNRVRVEKSLRESQAFYHSLVETLPQNLFRKDREGRLTFCNQRYCKLLGKSLNELIGKTDFDLFPDHLAKKYVADDEKVLKTLKPMELIEDHQTPEGDKLYVQVIKTPIFDSTGKVIGTQGLFWDVTERIRGQEKLAQSERRYRQLTEATLDAIIVADHEGNVVLFNPAAEHLFDYRAHEIMGKSLTVLMPDDLAPKHEKGLNKYLQTRVPNILGKPVELQGKRKDGVLFPMEIILTALNSESKNPHRVQFLGAIRDLTERNRLRSVLVQNEKLASIGLLSAGVAHEINNPLAFIGNNMAVLDRDLSGVMELIELYEHGLPALKKAAPDQAEKIRALTEEIDLEYIRGNLSRLIGRTREGVDRVARIVHSLRGLARSGKPEHQKVAIPYLVDTSLEMVQNRLKRFNIKVETDYDADPTITCVSTQISQVFLNLFVNATQAIEEANRDAGLLKISVKRLEEEMLIQIADNGPGIDEENLAQIFDPFYTTKDVGEGTGLGLSITYNIITGHGGRIEVDSTVGKGTTFRIYLPLESK